jgi:hypothetical protein
LAWCARSTYALALVGALLNRSSCCPAAAMPCTAASCARSCSRASSCCATARTPPSHEVACLCRCAVSRGLLHRYRRVRHASARHTPSRQGQRSSSDLLSSLGQLPPVVTLMVTHLCPLDFGKSMPVAPLDLGTAPALQIHRAQSIPTHFLATTTRYWNSLANPTTSRPCRSLVKRNFEISSPLAMGTAAPVLRGGKAVELVEAQLLVPLS